MIDDDELDAILDERDETPDERACRLDGGHCSCYRCCYCGYRYPDPE